MNHVIAALIVIGILFGALDSLNKADEVQNAFTTVATGMTALAESDSADQRSDSLSSVLEQIGLLVEEGHRIPRPMEESFEAFRSEAEELGESEGPITAEQVEALSTNWEALHARVTASDFQFVSSSLAGQGRKMTSEFYGIAKWSVEFAIGLIGIMALWLGIFKVAEDAGLIGIVAKILSPILRLLFPKVPREHPANGAIFASMSANFLGLDNAATPLSIKAMQELQTLNKSKDIITNDQIMLLALNTSSVNFIPISIIGYRVAANSEMPNDIILPTILATGCATVVAVIMAKALAPFSTDPAAVGEEAERITQRLLAERRGEGESDEEDQS